MQRGNVGNTVLKRRDVLAAMVALVSIGINDIGAAGAALVDFSDLGNVLGNAATW
jgi:hypothetical protein